MLPFLKPKKQISGTAVEYRKPDDEGKEADMRGVEMAMEELCRAKDKQDYKGMARALKAAFEILDSMPHEEGPHTEEAPEPHSYDAQKE